MSEAVIVARALDCEKSPKERRTHVWTLWHCLPRQANGPSRARLQPLSVRTTLAQKVTDNWAPTTNASGMDGLMTHCRSG